MPALADTLRATLMVLVVLCFALLTPAMVHARDSVDRLYLVGGAFLLAGVAMGAFIRLTQPFSPAQPVLVVGLALWVVSAWASRQRRRAARPRRRHLRSRRG